MAGRWYLARIVGTGTGDDPYRARTADLAGSHSAVIPNTADGSPRFAWALVHAPDDATLVADADHIPFPVNPGALWSSVPLAARQRVLDRINLAFGLSYQPAPGDRVRDVAQALLVVLAAGADVANLRGA